MYDDKGLSPRVRGNQMDEFCLVNDQRSIPACAGEPDWADKDGQEIAVYPRVCGGTPSRIARQSMNPGLSPRVRGNQCQSNLGVSP